MEEEEEEEEATGISQAASPSSLPLKTRIAVALISTVTDASRRSDGTVNRRLLSFVDFRSSPNPNPINGVKSYDVTVDPSRNLWYRVFVPTATTTSDDNLKLPVIVFFHGGGFAFLSADSKAYDAVCRRFARKIPSIVISVNYRLSPEHRFPSQYHDGFDVLKFLDNNQQKTTQAQSQSEALPENADLSLCFLAGDSAGGNIAHHVVKIATQFKFRQLKVMGLVAIQPFFGGEERTESEKRLVGGSSLVSVKRTDWLWKAFMPLEEGDRDHEVINVSGPRAADISGLVDFPATLVFVGGLDPLQDWQRKYYHWLKSSGKDAYLVEYPNTIHAFYVFPELPLSAHLISEVKHFVHKYSASSSSSSSFPVAAAAASNSNSNSKY